MMYQQAITDAVSMIAVPPTLEAEILAACRRASLVPVKPPATRYIPAVATAATCAAVLGVTLLSTGNLPGQLPTQPESSTTADTPQSTTSTPLATTDTPQSTTNPSQSPTTSTNDTTTAPESTTVTPQSTTVGTGTIPTGGSMQKDFIQWLSTVSDYETMTDAQLEAYYGRRILPAVLPEGLERRMTDGGDRGIFRRNEAKMADDPAAWQNLLKNGVVRDDAVVFDRTLVTYADFIDGRRELTVGISTAPYPRYNLGDLTRFSETLAVAGVAVQLHRYDDTPYSDQWCYTALAVVDGVEYLVEAWNISEEEFFATLTSLLE